MLNALGRFALAALIAGSLCALVPRAAGATPFKDVPSDHWAADAVAQLVHDGVVAGYPGGKFLGKRDLTRYEMATIVARAIAKVEADGASASDVQKLRKLMDLYKDQLEGMGVRIATAEDKLAALDHATQFAQRFSIHGTLYSQFSEGANTLNPTVPGVGLARNDPVQKFTDAFIETDASDHPYYGYQLTGVFLPRSFWELTPQYAVDPNLVVTLPIRLWDYHVGGYRQQEVGFGVSPTLEVSVAKLKRLTGLDFRVGTLENIKGSLTGLAYSPADNFHFPDKDPFRPFPQGLDITGTAYDYLDFQVFGSRIDRVGVNTGPFGPNTGYLQNQYLGPYWFGPSTSVYNSAPTSDSFATGANPLPVVYLSQNAQPSTIYVSFFQGPPACLAGCFFTGPNQPNEPAFSFVQGGNAIDFASPLPPGSSVTITYNGFVVSNNLLPQRYDVGSRMVYRIPGIPYAQIGVTYNRIFDVGGSANANYLQGSALPETTLVSDTVFGADFVFPLTYAWGPVKTPALFGETATSKYSKDSAHIGYVTDHAGIIGLRFKIWGGDQTLAYVSTGTNFIDGAPFEWSGQAPFLFSFYNYPQLPGFIGIGNDVTLNNQVDAAAVASGYSGPLLVNNPNFPFGTFPFPLFNQFHAEGPYYYSSYAPNTRGPQVQLNFPLTVGSIPVKLRLGGQALQELRPNSLATQIFGPGFSSTVREQFWQTGGGITLSLPMLSRTATVSLDGLMEHLFRNDQAPFVYAADPLLGRPAFNPAGSLELLGTGKTVMFYPNYANLVHTLGSAQASVPLTSALTANVQYVGQRYTGEALNTLTQSISERKTMLTGGVLYNIPKTNSSVNLWFAHYTYTDNQLPSYNWAQNRQNLYFTVKF